MLLPTLLVLTAAPVHLFVYSGSEATNQPAQLMKKEDSGAKMIDASGIWGLFHGGVLGVEDFDAFTRPPPQGWPDALAPQWKQAMKYCRGTLGPPPWKGLNGVASCSARIIEFLWQRYFVFQHVERVYFVEGFANPEKDTDQVTATTFTPRETEEHFILLKGHAKELDAHVAEAIAALMKPDLLQRQKRAVVDELPELSAAEVAKADAARDPFAGTMASGAAVKLPKQCEALPVSLSVTPASVLSVSLESRWLGSAKGRAPTASCTLELGTHDEDSGGMGLLKVSVIGAKLTCGTATASAEVASQMMGRGKPVDLMGERLISALAARYCH